MAVELKIPSAGESITEVQIGQWLKAEGDYVERDEPVVEIETDKASMELPSPVGGFLTRLLHPAGTVVPVGAVIATIEAAEKPAAALPAHAPKMPHAAQAAGAVAAGGSPAVDRSKTGSTETVAAGAGAVVVDRRRATTDTVVPPKPPPTGGDRREETVPMTMLRRRIAQRLVEAQQTMAMLTTFNEVDMSAVLALREEISEEFQKRYSIKLGFMSFFVKAAIDALKRFPAVNAEIRGSDIVYKNYYDIGIAVSTDQGLVVPVVRNAERLSFAEVELAIADLANRARQRKITIEELQGGTFTITNGGVFGSLLATPIINPPQSAILGLHVVQERPVARDGQVVIRPMMYVALTYDHRIIDGRESVSFLKRIKECVEDPARMLIEA